MVKHSLKILTILFLLAISSGCSLMMKAKELEIKSDTSTSIIKEISNEEEEEGQKLVPRRMDSR